MKNGIIYNNLTGKIHSLVTAANPKSLAIQEVPNDHSMLKGAATFDQYVDIDNLVVMDKTEILAVWDKTFILSDNSDVAVLSSLPIPCVITIDGRGHDVLDGTLELSVDTQGDYHVYVDHPHYILKNWIINAN